MTYIPRLELASGLIVDANYDYKTNSIHICEVEDHETLELNQVVQKYKEYIKDRLGVNKSVVYYVSYANAGRDVEDDNGTSYNLPVEFVQEYNQYFIDRSKRLLDSDY